MENRKHVKIFLVFCITIIFATFPFSKTRAYDFNTHAFLTLQATQFYQEHFHNNPLPQDLIPYLTDGSRREDDSPRWLHHFYDPVYNRGYTYDPRTGAMLNVGTTHESSKLWAQDSSHQNSPVYKAASAIASILDSLQKQKLNITTESDFSWDTALHYWVSGQKEKAMFALGHVLHLIEDASVPDHTRNNGHADGSPYEQWTSQFNLQNPDAQLTQRLTNTQPVILASLNDYFNGIAKYSNNGFYSKDTIGIQSGYNLPEPMYFESVSGRDYGVYRDDDGSLYYIVLRTDSDGSILISLPGDSTLKDSLINETYWSRLSTKSVQYSAGVMNLFFQQAEKLQLQTVLNKQTWQEQILQWFNAQIDYGRNLLGRAITENPENTPENTDALPTLNIIAPDESPIPLPTLAHIYPSYSPSPQPRVLSQQIPEQTPHPSPKATAGEAIPSQTPIPSPVALIFAGTQTPNNPQTLNESPTPTPYISPESSPEPEPSPTPLPIPTPIIQLSNNLFINNVQWRFDQSTSTEKGGIFTVEFDIKQLLLGEDLHTILVAWNTDLARTNGTKADGGNRLIPKYSVPNQTGIFINTADPLYGPTEATWAWQGTFENASSTFPVHVIVKPNMLRISTSMWLMQDELTGISRTAFENALGRQVGTNDFITVGYWPMRANETPQPDNVHYVGSFLDFVSQPVQYPQPLGIPAVKNLRWGIDPNSGTGYGLEFEYQIPFDQVSNQWNTGGYELRFYLDGNVDFTYDTQANMNQLWFNELDSSRLVWINYPTCSWNLREQNKSGFRKPMYEGCNRPSMTQFDTAAYGPELLPHIIASSAPSWIIKFPIMSAPKPFSDLNENDYISLSFFQYDTGPATGLYLRQIDSRKWYFSPTYTPLIPTIATSTP